MIVLIFGSILLIWIIYILKGFYEYLTYWRRQCVPGPKFFKFKWTYQPFHEVMYEGTQLHGPIHGVLTPRCHLLVINDIDVARELYIKQFHKFPIRYSFWFGYSNIDKILFFMPANDDWKRIRSLITPAFTTGKLKRMIEPIEEINVNFIRHLLKFSESGEEFDMKILTGAFSMDVIARCAYGIEIDSLSQPDHPIVTNAKKIFGVDATFSYVMCIMFPKIAKFFRLEMTDMKTVQYFDDLTSKIIQKRIESSSGKQNPDLIGLMIESAIEVNGTVAKNDMPKGISKDEISAQGILFFIAGFDTTNATLTHIFYYLIKHPEWQEKLHDELSVISHEKFDYEKLKELSILNAIIDETLRLKPPLPMIDRECIEPYRIESHNIEIPKNSMISVQPYVLHRDPRYFRYPLEFRPERFLDKTKFNDNLAAYIPFGLGPRLCVGMRFALNELRLALANFVINYKLVPNPDIKLEYYNGSMLMSPKKLMVRIQQR